ncbi:MAG: nodulation protein NfeD, partial [Bdellovibrionales bacterium]|nr:nodulation protein NfeD [Bdellovibrionales bacterium]
PAKADYLQTALDEAERQDVELAVIVLDTPGGLLTSTKLMVEELLEAPVPTVVYIAPSGGGAISAGVFIAFAANKLFAAPGTTIGAAHPVTGSGQDIGGDMREKIENYAASLLKSIAEVRGRNTTWAEQAVRESIAVTSAEAVDLQVIDGIAPDIDSLLRSLDGQTVEVDGLPRTLSGLPSAQQVEVEMSLRQRALDVLCDPNVAILLGLGTMVGLGLEMFSPGLIVPGLVGVFCLILSLVSAQVVPIATGGVLLLLLAAILAIIELFVPSFGAFGIGAIVSFIFGALYFVDSGAVWGSGSYQVDVVRLTLTAGFAFVALFASCILLFRPVNLVKKHSKRLVGATGTISKSFRGAEQTEHCYGKVLVDDIEFPALFRGFGADGASPGKAVSITGFDDAKRHIIAEPAD